MDWFSCEYGIVDPKTGDSLKWFEADCRRFGYIYQMAFYRAVLRESIGANGGERILRTVGSPACIAKNRFNLPGLNSNIFL